MPFLTYTAGILPNVLIQVLPVAIAGLLALVRARNTRTPTLVRSAGVLLLVMAVLFLAMLVIETVFFMNMAAFETTDAFRNIAFVALAREGATLLLVVALVLLLIAIAFAKQPQNPAGAAQPGYGPPDPRYPGHPNPGPPAEYGQQQPGYYGPPPGPQGHGYQSATDPGQHGWSSRDANDGAGGGQGNGGRDRGWNDRF